MLSPFVKPRHCPEIWGKHKRPAGDGGDENLQRGKQKEGKKKGKREGGSWKDETRTKSGGGIRRQ